MGWEQIPWYEIAGDWDKDFGVDEWHGPNVFLREGDEIYRTYFVDARGDEALGTVWSYLDITPSAARRSGRTRPRAPRRRPPTGGGTTTTPTGGPDARPRRRECRWRSWCRSRRHGRLPPGPGVGRLRGSAAECADEPSATP